ncbi:DeoR/GlpR family DNA-binding transcription regulator [Metasolibacillus sp. FSL K6-0083]|uniref:DeoR/GlpR family DNA-binding transcription regulator n=1 Tax=Metasolibacillus sp. FSL K6-0083 TaxID=2921416 RepID=UPI00315AA53D
MVNSLQHRRNEISKLVNQKNYVEISDLSNRFNVSEMTIRRDLEKMENEGLLIRVLGGAKPIQKSFVEDNLNLRASENLLSKQVIAREAVKLIEDGDVIGFDASTSAAEVAKLVKDFKNITVVTNNITITLDLISSEITTILLGGYVRPNSISTMGTSLKKYMESINIDKMFVSARGLTLQEGLTDSTIDEGEAKQAMIHKSNQIIALVDHSKIGVKKLFQVIPSDEINTIIASDCDCFTAEQKEVIDEFKKNHTDFRLVKNDE